MERSSLKRLVDSKCSWVLLFFLAFFVFCFFLGLHPQTGRLHKNAQIFVKLCQLPQQKDPPSDYWRPNQNILKRLVVQQQLKQAGSGSATQA